MIPFQQNLIHLVHFNDISVSPSRLNTSVLSTVLSTVLVPVLSRHGTHTVIQLLPFVPGSPSLLEIF